MFKISLRRGVGLLCFFAVSLATMAKTVTSEEALARVISNAADSKMKRMPARSAVKLRKVVTGQTTTTPMLYLFDKGEGFLLTPADDRFPAVLGYSDSGVLTSDSLPTPLRMFMQDYAAELEYELAQSANGKMNTYAEVPSEWESVAPLLKSKWNQDAPFNKYAPTMELLTNGEPNGQTFETPIGCVATAMAQLMYYHKWPEVGEGSYSYVWKPYSDVLEKKIECDFSKTPFAWDKMLDYYEVDANGKPTWSDEAGDAVAKLMYACATAVNMRFNADFMGGSGAYNKDLALSLMKYFKYSKSMRFTHRDYNSNLGFETIIYDNLKRGLPVIYDGRGSEGGHSFLCDGYAGNHYFHFNWGWGGMSDGYFYLARLNPSSLGIGGGNGGFNYSQGIVYDIEPVRDGVDTGEAQSPMLRCVGHFDYSTQSVTTLANGSKTSTTTFKCTDGTMGFTPGFWNMSLSPFTGNIGLAVMNTKGEVTYVPGTSVKDVQPYSGQAYITACLDQFGEGEYGIYPAFVNTIENSAYYIKVANGYRSYVVMTVNADGTRTYANADRKDEIDYAPTLAVTCFSYSGNVLAGNQHNYLLSLTNLSGERDYYGDLIMVLKDAKGRELATQPVGRYDVPASMSLPMSFTTSLNVLQKDYTVVFRDSYGRTLPGEFLLSISGTATPLTTQLRMQSFTPTDVMPNSTIELTTFAVANYGTTDVTAPGFKIMIYPKGSTSPLRGWGFSYPKLTIQKQTAVNLSIGNLPANLPEGEYDVKLLWAMPQTDGTTKDVVISQPIRMRAGRPVTGVKFETPEQTIKVGETKALTPILLPANATFRTLQWVSVNPEIATVDNTGAVVGVSPGVTYISASAYNGVQSLCRVEVVADSNVSELVSGETEIKAVYTVDGIRILSNPCQSQIATLPSGLYIIQTSKGTFKYRK